MTNNLDEFDQDGASVSVDEGSPEAKGGVVSGFAEAWNSKPLFKLVVVVAAVTLAIVVSLNMASNKPKEEDVSSFVKAPELMEAPGGKASPYFIEQNKQAANQRAEVAMQQGGSAMPTPVGQNLETGDLTLDKRNDPLNEYRAEAERLKQELRQEQMQNAIQVQRMQAQQQVSPVGQQAQQDDSLARAMQAEMSRLMQGWAPKGIAVVGGAQSEGSLATGVGSSAAGYTANGVVNASSAQADSLSGAMTQSARDTMEDRTLVAAGTVNYGQLLMEANSDIPGPILMQIVSGPMTGGRAVGEFQVQDEYIVMRFNLVHFKGKDYSTNILALNPNTTLGGMATEVDPRYMKRVLLPAAASFMSGFSDAMTSDSTTSVSGDVVITTKASNGAKDGMYEGLSSVGDSIGEFLKNEANRTKQLVRVAAGTPMGLFFISSVKEQTSQRMAEEDAQAARMSPGRQMMQGVQGYMGQAINPYYGQGMGVAPGMGMNPGVYNNGAYSYNTMGTPPGGSYNTNGSQGTAVRAGNVTITYPPSSNRSYSR